MDTIELDKLIERAAREITLRDAANERQRIWEESARCHLEKRREEHRLAWYCYHLDQAERLRRTMIALIDKHEASAAALLEGEGGGYR